MNVKMVKQGRKKWWVQKACVEEILHTYTHIHIKSDMKFDVLTVIAIQTSYFQKVNVVRSRRHLTSILEKSTSLTPHPEDGDSMYIKLLEAYIYTSLRALISKIRHSSFTVVRKFSREKAPLEGLDINGRKILKLVLIKGLSCGMYLMWF
jgi:hypothetical protein